MNTLFKKGRALYAGIALLIISSFFVFEQTVFADSTGSILPTGDGYSLQWTPSTGTTHYTLVDESACNGSTDYVQTTTVGQRDAFTTALASIPDGSQITAVAIKPCASRVNSGGTNPVMNVFYRYDGVNSADSGAYALSATTPIDLATTTYSGLTKTKGSTTTLQVGVVLTSGTKGARLSNIATTITYTPLTAPTALTATPSATETNKVTLSWTDNTSIETQYLVERGLSTTTFSQIGTTGSTTGTGAYTDTTASAGTTYYYRVRASNTGGQSSYSNTANATTGSLPASPTALSATTFSTTQIDLAWTDNATNETSYSIERSLSSSSGFAVVATRTANTIAYSDSGLSSGTTYYYRVIAKNGFGTSSYSNTANATTGSIPLTPSLSAYSSTSTPNNVELSFFSSGATSYSIERSFTSTSSFSFLATTSNTFYTDVAPGSGTWWYRVTASNTYGTSGYSTPDFETLP